MNKIIFHAFLILGLMNARRAAASVFEGHFVKAHEIEFVADSDPSSCQNDHGKWDESSRCLFGEQDVVDIKTVNGKLKLEVYTITDNGQSCTYQGEARQTDENTLTSSQQAEDYANNVHAQINSTCTVTAKFSEGATKVTIKANDHCSYYCGTNATLNIEGATR